MKHNEELLKIRKIFKEAGLIDLREKEERKLILKAQKEIIKKLARRNKAV